jgi:hypothetical protein
VLGMGLGRGSCGPVLRCGVMLSSSCLALVLPVKVWVLGMRLGDPFPDVRVNPANGK